MQQEWKEQDGCLHKTFRFKDFIEAFSFMTRVALLAEKHNHHPKWTNEWDSVDIWLCTHDAGDEITDKDHQMAKAIDRIAE